MQIHHDAPDRVVLVDVESPTTGVPPFDPSTRIGATIEKLLGAPASTWFATAAILHLDRGTTPTRLGYDAIDGLAERRVIAFGKDAARLLLTADVPLMIWERVRWKTVRGPNPFRDRVLPAFHVACFPRPGPRVPWWQDEENADAARQWLREQAGIE